MLIAPLMPGINDLPEQVEPLVRLAREAGADFLGGVALHLRDEVRDVFFGWLRAKRPDLLPMYEQLYPNRRGVPAPRRPQTSHLRRPRLGPQQEKELKLEQAGGCRGGWCVAGGPPRASAQGRWPRGVTGPAPPPSQESLF